MRVNTAFALAFVNAAAKDLHQAGNKVDHRRWVARAVADKVLNTEIGTVTIPAIEVHTKRGQMIRG